MRPTVKFELTLSSSSRENALQKLQNLLSVELIFTYLSRQGSVCTHLLALPMHVSFIRVS